METFTQLRKVKCFGRPISTKWSHAGRNFEKKVKWLFPLFFHFLFRSVVLYWNSIETRSVKHEGDLVKCTKYKIQRHLQNVGRDVLLCGDNLFVILFGKAPENGSEKRLGTLYLSLHWVINNITQYNCVVVVCVSQAGSQWEEGCQSCRCVNGKKLCQLRCPTLHCDEVRPTQKPTKSFFVFFRSFTAGRIQRRRSSVHRCHSQTYTRRRF